ncbi:hypothetical protein [Exiguobacterium sp. s193]|uniref:hypothetical protein n=1 Tax=Exiguobacterium sp. s193 TaxID=2751207 RepID=UPI001BEBA7BB|nr:hypothetical protein [Exiguobacterium sp. s193]
MDNIHHERKVDYQRFSKRARYIQTALFGLVLFLFLFLADDWHLTESSFQYFLLVPLLSYQWIVRFLKYRYFKKRFDGLEVWDHLGLPYVVISTFEVLIIVLAQFITPYVARPEYIGPFLLFFLTVLSLDWIVDKRIKRLDPTHLSEQEMIRAEREEKRIKY